jgi:paraquat-inducible protein B
LDRLVEAGLRAKLVSQSFVTGQMLVELDISPDTPANMVGSGEPGVPEIPAMQSDFDELRQQLLHAPIAQTFTQMLHTMAAIEKTANHIDDQIGPLSTSAQRAFDSATRATDAATVAIQQVQHDASSTLQEAHGLASDTRQELAARGAELSKALVDADQAVVAIHGLADSANSLIAVRTQSRNDLEAILRDVANSTSSLRDFSQTIDRDPSILLRGRAQR